MMRRCVIIIIILIINTFAVYPMDVSLTTGIQKRYTNYYEHDNLYITLDLWQSVYDFKLYARYTNEFSFVRFLSFRPSQDYYTVGIAYTLFSSTLKLEHSCYHPVASWGVVEGIQGGYTKLEVELCFQ